MAACFGVETLLRMDDLTTDMLSSGELLGCKDFEVSCLYRSCLFMRSYSTSYDEFIRSIKWPRKFFNYVSIMCQFSDF